jgi:hypothetical protein
MAKSKPMFYEFAILKDSEHIGAVSVFLSDDYTEGELVGLLIKNIGVTDMLQKRKSRI